MAAIRRSRATLTTHLALKRLNSQIRSQARIIEEQRHRLAALEQTLAQSPPTSPRKISAGSDASERRSTLDRGTLLKGAAGIAAGLVGATILQSGVANANETFDGYVNASFFKARGVPEGMGIGVDAQGSYSTPLLQGVVGRGAANGVIGVSSTGNGVKATGANGVWAQGGAWNGDANKPQGYGVYAIAASDDNTYAEAVHGHAPGQGNAVVGESGSGTGVWGSCGSGIGVAAESGSSVGLSARSESSYAISATSGTGTGISTSGAMGMSANAQGWNPSDGPGYAVYARCASDQNYGEAVHGKATGSGVGLAGESDSGYGVWGKSGNGYGIYAESSETHGLHAIGGSAGIFGQGAGLGVYGLSNAGQGVFGRGYSYGVEGQSTGGAAGVHGISDSDGVHGSSNGSGAGVLGESGGGPGVWGSGRSEGVRGTCADGIAVNALATKGRGGVFAGGAAQIRLAPSKSNTHPKTGKIGDLFLDANIRLWLCVTPGNPAGWKQIVVR